MKSFEPETINPIKVKQFSEFLIRNLGGDVPENIPPLASFHPRFRDEISRRALVLWSLHQIVWKAPVEKLIRWLRSNDLWQVLTPAELQLLKEIHDGKKEDATLTRLFWTNEAVWCLLWVLGGHDDMMPDEPVADSMASLLPDLRHGETAAAFLNRTTMRSNREIYEMHDFYYRLHWYTAYCRTENRDCSPIGHDFVLERRKALNWTMHPGSDWDHPDLRFFYRAEEKAP